MLRSMLTLLVTNKALNDIFFRIIRFSFWAPNLSLYQNRKKLGFVKDVFSWAIQDVKYT